MSGDICPSCSGSGEGMYDGTTCGRCGGSGDLDHKWGRAKERDEDYADYMYDRARDERMERLHELNP